MGLYPRKKTVEVTLIDEHTIAIRGVKFISHNHELQEIKKLLNSIIKNQIKAMAKSQERFDLLMGRLDTVTSDIAADYKKLLDEIQAGSDSISEESFAKHEANIAKLEELGASVDNPVPEPTPEG